VYQMFLASGVPITRIGYEYKLLDFMQLTGQNIRPSRVVDKLRLAPDFVIRTRRDDLELVEVKYCQQGRFHEKEAERLPLLEELWAPTIVLVSYNLTYEVPHFLVMRPPYELDEKRNPKVRRLITEEEDWGVSEQAIKRCSELVPVFAAFMSEDQRRKNRKRG
jgi:hypothetical protein